MAPSNKQLDSSFCCFALLLLPRASSSSFSLTVLRISRVLHGTRASSTYTPRVQRSWQKLPRRAAPTFESRQNVIYFSSCQERHSANLLSPALAPLSSLYLLLYLFFVTNDYTLTACVRDSRLFLRSVISQQSLKYNDRSILVKIIPSQKSFSRFLEH